MSILDVRDLVHELGTNQIELEMQNEELRRAQEELEASRSRYGNCMTLRRSVILPLMRAD